MQPQMTEIIKLRGSNSIVYVSSGGLFDGGLLKICSSRMGAYSTVGGQFKDLRYMYFCNIT